MNENESKKQSMPLLDRLSDKKFRLVACEQNIWLFSLYYFTNFHHFTMPAFHRDMYKDLEEMNSGLTVGVLWKMYRESAKTTLTKIKLIHNIVYQKRRFNIWASFDQKKAEANLFDIALQLQTNKRLIEDFGNLFYSASHSKHKQSEKKSIKEFITTNNVKVKAYSTGQSIRGEVYGEFRPDFIVLDDIETMKTVVSEARTSQVTDFIDELLSGMGGDCNVITLANSLSYSGSIAYFEDKIKNLPRWKVRDVAVVAPDSRGHDVPVWPEKYVLTDEEAAVINAKILDHKHWVVSLESKRRLLGETVYNREMLNRPLTEDEREFKLSWLQNVYEEKNLTEKVLNTYVMMDVADTKDRKKTKLKGDPDYTGIVVVSIDTYNNWYVRYAKRERLNAPEKIEKIFWLWQTFNPIKIGVEKKAFEDEILPYIKIKSEEQRIYPVVEELKHHGLQKEERIRGALQGRFQHGKIFFSAHPIDDTDKLKMELYDFPKGKHDDMCLVGDTLISTNKGFKKIKDIKVGDKVITPFGIRKVLASKKTGEDDVITKCCLTGTKNHPVFIDNNFDNLDALTYNSNINKLTLLNLCQWKYKKLLSLMESNTGSWVGKEGIILVSQNQILEEKILKDYMLRFGNFIAKRKFLKAMLFTIRTVILLTTTLITWSVYLSGNIFQNIIKEISKILNSLNALKTIWTESGNKQKRGINLKRAENGIENTQIKFGKILKLLILFVKNVVNLSSRHNQIQDFAQGNAKCEAGEEEIQKSGSRFNQKAKQSVYNILVDKDNVYYANGILVGNCDSLAYTEQLGAAPYSQKNEQGHEMTDIEKEFHDVRNATKKNFISKLRRL